MGTGGNTLIIQFGNGSSWLASSSIPGMDLTESGRNMSLKMQNEGEAQCYQIWRFIGLWATFKPLATINLPKSPTFLGKFCRGVKIDHFSSEIIFGQLL